MRPKVILLDWDGTIVDKFPLIHQAMNATLEHYGHPPFDDAAAAIHIPRPDSEKFPEFFGDQSDEALKYFQDTITRIDQQSEKPKLIDNAEAFMDFLQNARKKGVYVGIVSNSRVPAIQRDLQKLGWDNYVDVIVASDSGIKSKPDPEAYKKALEHYPNTKLRPSEVLYVGDANTDLKFARNTGMKFIGIGNKFTEPLEPKEHVSGLQEIITRLQYAERMQTKHLQ